MKYFLVLAFLAVAFAASIENPNSELPIFDEDSEVEIIVDDGEEGIQQIAPQFILSWQARRAIRRLQKQMPCGFPQHGIPPLAPLKKREANLQLEEGIVNTNDIFSLLRIDGLDNFKINRFKLNVITSKVIFDLNFRNIRATAPKYHTDTIVNALNQLGISVQYEGDGELDFGLKNLRIAGTLKYKIPVLWGSIKIKSLKATVTLGSCESKITGLLGNGKLNEVLNKKLEQLIESGINDNQQAITDKIENTVVPRVNKKLKGNNFWTLIDMIFSDDGAENEDDPIQTKCVAPADPWA